MNPAQQKKQIFSQELLKSQTEKQFLEWLRLQSESDIASLNTKEKHQLLVHSVASGFRIALKKLLDLGIKDVSYSELDPCYQPKTALLKNAENFLHVAKEESLATQNSDISQILIEGGSNVNFISPISSRMRANLDFKKTKYKGEIGQTALMSYALAGSVEMVDYILIHGGAKTINVRNFDLLTLGAFCAMSSEETVIKLSKNMDGYRFETALSLAFASQEPTSVDVFRLLLKHGADLSIFSDAEYYGPLIVTAVIKCNDDYSVASVRPRCEAKVQLLVEALEQQNFHQTECATLYHILQAILSEDGLDIKQRSYCSIL